MASVTEQYKQIYEQAKKLSAGGITTTSKKNKKKTTKKTNKTTNTKTTKDTNKTTTQKTEVKQSTPNTPNMTLYKNPFSKKDVDNIVSNIKVAQPDYSKLPKSQTETIIEKGKEALKEREESFNKWYTEDKKDMLYNADGSYRDLRTELANFEAQSKDKKMTALERYQYNTYKKELEKAIDHSDFLQQKDKEKELKDVEEKKKFYKMQDAYNDTFGERALKKLSKVTGNIANMPFQAFDVVNDLVNPNFDINNPNNVSNIINDELNKSEEQIQYGSSGTEQFALNTFEGLADFGAHFLFGMATGITPLATMGAKSGLNKYEQNRKEGYDEKTSLGNAVLTGSMTMLTEKIGLDKFTNIINSGLGQFTLGALVSSYVSDAVSEGAEEGLEYLTEPLIDFATLGKNVDYDAGELFMSVALGMSTGGILGGVGNTISAVKSRKTANQLKADMQVLTDYANKNTLSDTESRVINEAIVLGNKALANFESKSVIGNAIQFESDQATPMNVEEIRANLYNFMQPQVDAESNTYSQRKAVQSILDNAQKVLSNKGIRMDALQYSNLDEDTKTQVDTLQKLATDLKQDVVFNSELVAKDGSVVDGCYDKKTKRIIINPLGKRPALSSFVHELTHGTELSKIYDRLKSLIKATDSNFDEAVQIVKGDYESIQNLSTEDAEKEYVAITLQEMLGNEEFVNRLVKYDTSLASRIYEGVKKVVFNTKTSQDIEYAFMKAFRDSGISEQMTLQYSKGLNKDDLRPDGTRKDLLAIRNTGEDGLKKSLEMGGFPMPSIAITKDTIQHDGFGDISITFDKDTVDPNKGENDIYNRDAYTPTTPPVEYKANEDVVSKIEDKYYELSKIPNNKDNARALYRYFTDIEEKLKNNEGEQGLIERLYDDFDMKKAYLLDKGVVFEPEYKTEKVVDENKIEYMVNKLGKDFLDEVAIKDVKKRREIIKNNLDTIKKHYADYIQTSENISVEEAQKIANELTPYQVTTMIRECRKYTAGNLDLYSTKFDDEATSKKMNDLVDVEDYKSWVNDLFSGVEEKKGIYNGKDIYTNKGNRRSWEDLHYNYTLNNLVKAMKSEQQQGKAMLGSNVFGSAATRFDSIDDVIASEELIQNIDDETMKSLKKEITDDFDNVVTEFAMYKDDFMHMRSVEELLIESLSKGNTKEQFARYLKREGKGWTNYSNDVVNGLWDVYKKIQELPTRYFEAKPKRAVPVSEWKQVYVPIGTDADLIKQLNDLGVETIEYDSSIEGDKLNKINEHARSLKFSKGLSTEDIKARLDNKYMSAIENNDMETAQKIVDEVANNSFKNSVLRDKNGNLIKMYHGSPSKFTVFNGGETGKGNYFSPWKTFAEEYGDTRAFYLNLENPIEYDENFESLNDVQDGDEDGFIYLPVDMENGVDQNKIGDTEVVVYDANNIKSADPIVYDDDGNVIPLSRRFDVKNNDIRYSIGLNSQDLHEQALEEYGAFEKGEIPVRDVDIAKETDFGNTNRFARTIAESSSFNDEQVDLLKSKIGEGEFAYEPLSNEKLQHDATFKIEKVGLEKSIENYLQSDGYSSRSIAEGEILLDTVARSGNNEMAIKLASKLSMQLTEAGRAVQAARLLKRLTPQGQLVATERTIDKLQKSLDARYGKKSPHLEINDELKSKLLNAKNDTEMYEALDEISVEVSKQIPSTLMDKLNTWRYLAMLGNPRTHVRNVLGNAMFYPLVSMKNNIGTVLEAVAKKSGKLDTRTKSVINPLSRSDKELIAFGKENFAEYKQIFENSGKYDLSELIEKNRDVYSNNNVFGKTLNKLVKTNSDALEWGDVVFSKQRYASSLAQYMKANNLTPKDVGKKEFLKAQEYAYNEALKQTYRDDSTLATGVERFAKTNKGTQLLVDSILPFKKTPMNVLSRGIEYSPIGLITSVTKGSMDLKNGKITANEFIDSMSSGLTGTGVTLLGVFLASIGAFRTRDDDKDRKQQMDNDLGEQDYALVFPHGTYTIDWASPMIMPLAIGAELYNGIDLFENFDDLITVASKITEPIFETSMLSGVASTLQSYDSGQKGVFNMLQNAITSYVNQYFPTLFGQIARSIDDTRRTTYPNTGVIDKTGKQILNKIPGLSYMNEPYINRKGEVQKQEGNNFFVRAFLNMLSPGYYKSNTIDEYDKELYRLYNDDVANIGALPSSSTNKVTYEGETHKLLDEDYTKFNQTRYSLEREFTNVFIDSEVYDELTDSERVSVITKMREYAGKEAKKQYLTGINKEYDDSEYAKARGAIEVGIPLHEYFLTKNYYKGLSGKEKKSDYINYLVEKGYDNEAMSYLYDMVYSDGKLDDHIDSLASGGTLKGSSSKKTSKKSSSSSTKKIDDIIAKARKNSASTSSDSSKVDAILKKLKNNSTSASTVSNSELLKRYLKEHSYDAALFD